MQAFADYAGLLSDYPVPAGHVSATATAAMREATNGAAFRDAVQAETGIDIRIIGGEGEAGMSLHGASAVLPADTRHDMFLFDIGGGITEFIRAGTGNCRESISRQVGVVPWGGARGACVFSSGGGGRSVSQMSSVIAAPRRRRSRRR